MGTATLQRQPNQQDDCIDRRLWTREEFERAGELGLFKPGERLELIEGEIIRKVAPMKTPHASGIRAVNEALEAVFLEGYVVSVQLPFALGKRNEPEPDISVLTGHWRDYVKEHPSTALLIVEVADTTLHFDRTRKAAVYARAGILDYWIVNLQDRMLEVHREPGPMTDQPLGYHYRSITRLTEMDTVSPLAMPNASIAVADLLP
jgi:Uma2 family endonuclease